MSVLHIKDRDRFVITNIVICYANEDEVIEYSRELSRQTAHDAIFLVVVVNKEGKGAVYLSKGLEATHINYKVVFPNANLGYLNGLIYGFDHSQLESKWYILSNTDIKLPDLELVEKLQKNEYLKREDIWLIGPSIYAPRRKQYSNPYLRERPKRSYYMVKNLGMRFPHLYTLASSVKSKMKTKYHNNTIKPASLVYAVHGSFMIVKSDLLKTITELPRWELLYDEEQYLAEIVRENKKHVFYDSGLEIHHLEGASTGRIDIRKRFTRMRNSNKRILNNYY